MSASNIILDPGHGLGNRSIGVFDPGTVVNGVREADVVMDWANEIRALLPKGRVVRTRRDHSDPAPVNRRASIAREYNGVVMLSLHCNWAKSEKASGTEVFYRGEKHQAVAAEISAFVASTLGIPDRGPKLEAASQHARLAVMAFQPCFLLEIGFLSSPIDRDRMLSAEYRLKCAVGLAEILKRYLP